mmetsp:Transcript_4144/g.9395  ORF Transcript_4144/g.9395 Transcript_4144/m.9395 type:complete len:200 (+) Transcript_4144:550-1149(+)
MEKDFSVFKSPNKFTISEENSLTFAKLLQQVSSLTNESLHSDTKEIIGMNVAWQSTHSAPAPPLQTEPDMSTARHRLNSCSVEHAGTAGLLVVGASVGVNDGLLEGTWLGSTEGVNVGPLEGTWLEAKEGLSDALMVGDKVGDSDLQGVSLSPKFMLFETLPKRPPSCALYSITTLSYVITEVIGSNPQHDCESSAGRN